MQKRKGIIGVYANPKKDPEGQYVSYITSLLGENSLEFRIIKTVSENLDDIGLLIVLGGDGTILSVIKKISDINIPLFNVNIGTLGFLSEVEINEFSGIVPKLAADEGRIEERLMINAVCGDKVHTAVNEFAVMKENRQKMVHVSVYINGDMAGKYDADGVLVSTPTGASAYSLSAGGPIVYPNANCLLITPVCPHSIATRPIVVNADDEIKICSNKGDIMLATDWQEQVSLTSQTEIIIGKSKRTAKFYKLDKHGFFDKMREKLIYNINR